MTDGRKRHHARAAAAAGATLTTLGLVLSVSPAAAAPTPEDVDAAQARVETLSQKATKAERRHDRAASSLRQAERRLKRTTSGLRRHQQRIESIRAQLADTVVAGYSAGAGTAVPAGTTPVRDPELRRDSTQLLANLVLVSEDAGPRGDALANSNEQVDVLAERRVRLQRRVDLASRDERTSRGRERTATSRETAAAASLADLRAERMAALGGPAVAYAKAQVGKSYVYGAAGPSAFDCSGLTMMAWQQAGVSLPHNSGAQYSSGPRISESELQPGDLVFYYTPISHVGMYIGNGQVVNALNPGSGVRISGLHDMPYVGAVRPGG